MIGGTKQVVMREVTESEEKQVDRDRASARRHMSADRVIQQLFDGEVKLVGNEGVGGRAATELLRDLIRSIGKWMLAEQRQSQQLRYASQ